MWEASETLAFAQKPRRRRVEGTLLIQGHEARSAQCGSSGVDLSRHSGASSAGNQTPAPHRAISSILEADHSLYQLPQGHRCLADRESLHVVFGVVVRFGPESLLEPREAFR